MKRLPLVWVSVLALALAFPPTVQAKVTIKLASQVAENTPWGNLLNRMASEWSLATKGEVELRIYHGAQTDERSMLRQLNQNQIQAAMLSTFGLKLIVPEIMTLSCPFLIRNNQELNLVLGALKPDLEAQISSKGYYTLAWSQIGWVRFFSRRPVFVPADLKAQKLGTSDTEPELADVFKALGYQITPVATSQILVNLTGGQIDAVYASPVIAGGLQIFALAGNMASIKVAPFMGAIIMNQRAWRSIPEQYKPELIRIARAVEAELDTRVQALEDEVVGTMTGYGLRINQVSPAQEQLWYNDVGRVLPGFMGTLFDRSTYSRIETLLRPYR
ncbi:MAG: TRAP transporter substrate-binding protein DctP [Treponema sp.]|nr:TRAP transporter substrate-binding protein DctP [Treponema sp.]